jgi:hypothetical protein
VDLVVASVRKALLEGPRIAGDQAA